MSTTITDVTELQAMEDDLDGDYVLGNNIDASATSGWEGGLGFDPIGDWISKYSYSRPWSDDFGYAGSGGNWTIYPSDGVFFDKVDEETSDEDTTYIQATTGGTWVLLAHDATALNIPASATNIAVRIRASVRNVGSFISYIQGMLNINGTEYLVGSDTAITSQTYATKSWNMTDYPPVGSGGWTVANVLSLATAGVGVKVSYTIPDVRITQIWIEVTYSLIFAGTLDGQGYTISDLFINRPTEDYVGLFGHTDGATITDCVLTGADITGKNRVGALVGDGSSTTISGCSMGGAVSGDDYIGNLVGWIRSSTISQCYATGSATGSDDYIGGLMGVLQACTMNNSYSRASVTGDRYIGGLVGYSYSSEAITNSYSTGAVTGNTDVGGLLGYSEGTITNCFWDTQTSGQATSDGGTGKTTALMKTYATFDDASWDIGTTTTDRNDGYPFLSWEIDESDTIWKTYGTGLRSFTSPDLFDHKGRPPKGARARAYRVDTHLLIEEELLDEYGSATFTELPNDVDAVFHVTWGGPRTPKRYTREGFS